MAAEGGVGSRIYSFGNTSSGGGGGGSSAFRSPVEARDSVNALKPTGAVSIDAVPITITGQRVLFTNLSGAELADNNKVFTATVAAGLVTAWTLQTDGQAGDGSPTDGDNLYVKAGTVHGDTEVFYNGTAWFVPGGGANTALSNLTATGINQGLVADVNGTRDLGTAPIQWRRLFVQQIRDSISNTVIDINNRILNDSANATAFNFSDVTNTVFHKNLVPSANNTVDVGSSINVVRQIYSNIYSIGLSGQILSTTTPSGATAILSRAIGLGGNYGIATANNGTPDAVPSGSIYIESGNKTVGTGNSGDIFIRSGTSAGGTRGDLFINVSSLTGSSVGWVWTLQDIATGRGAWVAAATGANTSLSNLTATSINQTLRPDAAGARDIGTLALYWNVIYGNAYAIGSNATDFVAVLNRGTRTISSDTYGPNALVMEVDNSIVRDGVFGTPNRATGGTGKIAIYTGSATTSGNTGTLRLYTGLSVSGNSGNIILETGTATGTRGSIILNASTLDVVGTTTNFGNITNRIGTFYAATIRVVSSLNLTNSGDGGRAQLLADDTTPSGVSVSGAFRSVNTSPLSVYTTSGATSGGLQFETGNASAGNSGNIVLRTGTATVTRGTINFMDASLATSVVNYVWTLQNITTGAGAWAAAPSPTGTANAVAFFNGAGTLSSEAQFSYNTTTNSLAIFDISVSGSVTASGIASIANGFVGNAGIISTTGRGARAWGFAFGASTEITASDDGTFAGGYVTGGKILSENAGSFAYGNSSGAAGTRIRAATGGDVAMGNANTGGILLASGGGSVAFGIAGGGTSTVSATAQGAHVFGYADGSSPTAITATSIGSGARGYAQNGGIIRATTGAGAWASGRAISGSSLISSIGAGAHAFGTANTAGQINSNGIGSFAAGQAVGSGQMSATSDGSIALGFASTSGTMTSSDQGSITLGHSNGSGSSIVASSAGAFATGFAFNGGQIVAANNGAMARGYADGASSLIQANSNGAAYASGRATGAGQILSTGLGSHSLGYANGTNSRISAANHGALANGYAESGGQVRANGAGSFCGGWVSTSAQSSEASGLGSVAYGHSHNVTANFGQAFGIGHVNSSFASFVVGQYASAVGTAGSSVATDIAFAVGIGVLGTPANAFSIGKNADIKIRRTITPALTTGAQTIDRPSGTVNFAIGATTLVVTNNLVTTDSIIFTSKRTADPAVFIEDVVAGAGSFTITLSAAPTVELSVGFLVTN